MNSDGALPFVGFLTDTAILDGLRSGCLLRKGTWDPDQVRECSYVARLGRAEIIELDDSNPSTPVERRIVALPSVAANLPIKLDPGQTALLYFAERFDLEDDIMALTVPRALMFSVGLMPAVSYVDPGYGGEFFVPVTNVTQRVVQIPFDLELARVFFFQLVAPVSSPFNESKSKRISQELRSILSRTPRTDAELDAMSDEDLMRELCDGVVSGPEIAALLRRQVKAGNSRITSLIERDTASIVRTRRSLLLLVVLAIVWPPLLVGLTDDQWRGRFGAVGTLVLAVAGALGGIVYQEVKERVAARKVSNRYAE